MNGADGANESAIKGGGIEIFGRWIGRIGEKSGISGH